MLAERTPPLMYKWCDEYYLGAAHGLAGIFYMLLSAHLVFDRGLLNAADLEDIQKSVDWLVRHTRQKNKNYPPCFRDREADLVHFCHGAPGFAFLFQKAYEVWPQKIEYFAMCRECAELTWKYGVLKKGPGLCHGLAGNGYVFLLVYRMIRTKERSEGNYHLYDSKHKKPKPKKVGEKGEVLEWEGGNSETYSHLRDAAATIWLKRAQLFAKAISDLEGFYPRTPDNP